MEFGRFKYLKDFDFAKYFGITAHSLQLDNSQWKITKIIKDIKKGFNSIKCSVCGKNSTCINFLEET